MSYRSANESNPRHHHHHNHHHHRTHAKHCTHSKENHRASLNKALSEQSSNFGYKAQEKLYPGERVSNSGNSFDVSLILFKLVLIIMLYQNYTVIGIFRFTVSSCTNECKQTIFEGRIKENFTMNGDQTLVKNCAMNREILDDPLEISILNDKQTKANFTGKGLDIPMKPEKPLQNGKIKTRSNIEIFVSGKENHNKMSKSNTNRPHKNRKNLKRIVIVATTQETTFYSEESTLAAKPTLIRGEQI